MFARSLATPSLLEGNAPAVLNSCDGLWASPGSPYKSFDGMLRGIEFARIHNRPFLGTCGGFQYALIECARNVIGIPDANTAEEDPQGKNIGISRDPSRTPMQWAGSANAGFSSATPWLPLGHDYQLCNVDQQSRDDSSLLSLYRRLIALRRKEPALCIGSR